MLDALIAAAHAKLRPASNSKLKALRFATKHNWVDRIHHYVVSFASTNPAWRLHSLHVPYTSRDTQSLGICSNSAVAKRSPLRPRFCNHPGILKYTHPLNSSLPTVPVWEHIDLRYELLKRQYPTLELEVILLSSQRLSSTSGVLSSTFYNYEALEITALTRGKRCINDSKSSLNTTLCTTVFIDDYRYERDTVRTNLVEWYGVISMLRGGAQGYVWIRLVLLMYGAYTAAGQLAGVQAGTSSRFKSTMSIVCKIPFEVIVYSSLLPVSGYVIAQFLDSSFMDIFLDSYWAAVGGTIKINLLTFLRSTAVQMRNVWILALLVTLTVFAVRKTRDYWGEGLPAIRGLVISFTSTLTVFGPYKETTLRNTDIINLFLIADEGQNLDIIQSNLVGKYNISSYFFDDSAVMLLFCIGVVIGLASIIKILNASPQFKVDRSEKSFGKASYNSTECRSVIQLMNIAMMTDPWNFFWLRALGVQLYLYKTRSGLDNSFDFYAVILPFAKNEIEERTGLSSIDLQLLDSASSRDVPMSVLLQSG
ncbi:Transcriptional activator Myb [Phytophthora nicotianae]|uniref:Transcriptional activator Myb n=1 Tax=Phytophthora nicotianae TaxID=4792 RepID=A0A0W8DRC7_PHYNI|nr:Transcriptional activator Myb [Phytophthora nicotianae]